ncbi:pre-RNA processing PIH1/Nop17 protein (macronuclear) [Tetrahymena thermophila SB210]|uniref:PIH1 domain-containing protein 2 n=1 Tax=Tetrahymena thermophila (strain SB210) TaxID=312017 RepID=I7M632_TETTS|nr:pre-RNA processing PIH1/Nop17 protein [Tetrahymena thermophila SB210]EAR84114.2 pre-RNA processing PIH1/Nop17 protein [Tetrahymena thermophila SB210]|eukprot:XP_001031777.2 pre-RNA processing PIH1/Nop17 protein [Tetrahymena thermophila SB210]
MDGSLGKGLLNQIAGSMGGLNNDQLKQAENIWKMLDDLSESNPEGYKNFVKNNLQNGFEEIKKEKDEKIKELKVNADPAFLLKMQATLQSFKLKKEEHPLYESLRVVGQDSKKKLADIKKSIDKEVKIYINVLMSNRVRAPINDQGKEIESIKQMEEWKVIPYSVQEPEQRKSESLGNMVYFYNFVINDEVCKMMSGAPPLTEQLVTFVIEKMNNCLKEHRNPLLKLYNYMEDNEIIHYQISKMSVVRHKSKKFKLADKKQRQIPPILLEPEADRQFDLQKVKQEIQMKKNAALSQMQQGAQSENLQQSQANSIQNVDDLKKRQLEDEKSKEMIKEQVLDGLKIVSKEDKEKKNEKQKPKKVLIQEIETKEVPKTAKQILEEQVEKPSYTLKELTESIYLEFLLFKANSIDDMILDISEKKIKLEVPLVYKLDLPLPCKIDTEQVQPKWSKKTKVLKLTLLKVQN